MRLRAGPDSTRTSLDRSLAGTARDATGQHGTVVADRSGTRPARWPFHHTLAHRCLYACIWGSMMADFITGCSECVMNAVLWVHVSLLCCCCEDRGQGRQSRAEVRAALACMGERTRSGCSGATAPARSGPFGGFWMLPHPFAARRYGVKCESLLRQSCLLGLLLLH